MRAWNPGVVPGLFVTLGALAACAAGCSTGPNHTQIDHSRSVDSGTSSGVDSGGMVFANDASPDATANQQGSPCGQPGQTVACWTGSLDQRNVGTCHDGTQTCLEAEVPVWSACVGEVLACGQDASVPIVDSGAPRGDGSLPPMCTPVMGGSGSAGGMTVAPACVPGSSRWCDDGSCYWGQQQCQSDGTWGDCNDTNNNQGPPGCPAGNINYDENCCVQSGQCCAHAVDGNNYGSVGSCGGVDPCSCTQLCVPNAVRWCRMDDDAASSGSWGQQSCREDGTWAECNPASSVPTGCPSGGSFDQGCCATSGQCCQAFDSEGSDPISLNCPATACSGQWTQQGDDDGGDYLASQGGSQGSQGSQGGAWRPAPRGTGGHHRH